MTSAPFRDDHDAYRASEVACQRFAQHVSVAIELLEQFEQVPRRLAGIESRVRGELSIEDLERLSQEARLAWEGLWQQLDQAREIANKLKRDVAAYDRARRRVGDLWMQAADVSLGPRLPGSRRRAVNWRSAPVKPAHDGIAALRASVPEVTINTSTPQHVDLRSHGWLIDGWAVILIALIAGLVLWQCAL